MAVLYQYRYRGSKDGRLGKWVYSALSSVSKDRGWVEGVAIQRVEKMAVQNPWASWEYEIVSSN